MTEAVVEADPSRGAGYALIRIPRGAGALADPRLRVSREGHETGTLGPAGWQVADAQLTPLTARADREDLVLGVGPAVVDHIASGVVMLALPSIRFDAPVFWPDLPLAPGGPAAATVILTASPSLKTTPITVSHPVEPPGPTLVSPPDLPIEAGRPGPSSQPVGASPRSRWLLPALAGLIAALVAFGVWSAVRQPVPPVAPPQALNPSPPAPPAPRDCALGSIQNVVDCAPDAAAIYQQAERRWDGGQVNDGLVLMQIAADRGSGAAALRLAQLYDPATFRPGGPIPHASEREAAKYYRRAAQLHQNGGDAPRQALRRRLQGDADSGDTLAELTLKDFWP
jgi:hypothetical protein